MLIHMSWINNVPQNILPLSVEQNTLKQAMEEWEYHGDMYDQGAPNETCQLCDHPDIRFQFEIINKHNSNNLLVGSECINKFDGIAVLDAEGNLLSKSQGRQKVNKDRRKLITDAQVKSMFNSLIDLSRQDDDFNIQSFIHYYQAEGYFTPKQLSTLFWRLKKYKISHNKPYFKTSIRKTKNKEALLSLRDFQLREIWQALSSSQKEFVHTYKK